MTKRLFSLALLCATGLPLIAQNATTSLHGIVTDATGAKISGASLMLDDAAIGLHLTGHANSHGEYSFQQLMPGDYTLTATAPGFGKAEVKTTLLVAQPATLNATLSAHAVDTTVEVSGEALINTVDASIGNAMDNKTIMALPSEARQPEALLALQPGVLYLGNTNNTDSRAGAVSGARADQTNITLDGVDNNDQVSPSPFEGVLRTPLDALEEFRVTTSNANADTGRSSGGQVNLVTKAGSNTLHGSVYEYNRSSIGVANDFFNKQSELNTGLPNRPGGLIRNTYGVSLGGPIRKDKLFFFGNYEGDRINESQTVNRTVPLDSFRAGNISYYDATGSVTTLAPSDIATMDPNCSSIGTCPLGPGVDPAVLAVFAQYPHSNGTLLGDGLNTGSYTFATPLPTRNNVYVARMDWNIAAKHRLYVRGSFQNDQNSAAQLFPGQPATFTNSNDSKGILANYTWTPTSNAVNNLRYGFVRESYASKGIATKDEVFFDGISSPESTSRTSSAVVPLQNVIDDFTWSKGKHTIQAGANFRRYTYQSSTDANSYTSTYVNPFWLADGEIANQGSSFDPAAFGFTAVDDSFGTSYDAAISNLAGILGQESQSQNYRVSSDGTMGTAYVHGAQVPLAFRSNELEYYLQDSWKPTPSFNVVLGLRHSLQQTPFETHGQQVQPTFSLHDWFNTRAAQAALGNSVQPDILFAPSGQARGGKPLYPMNWGNVAPRVAIAYSPAWSDGWLHKLFGSTGQSSIRAGFGMYYDHFGQGLISNYVRNGAFGLTSTVTNSASALDIDHTARFTGLHDDPGLVAPAPTSVSYPFTPSDDPLNGGSEIAYGLDDKIQTPYSEDFNLSFQRQLGGFIMEADYVGRLGRHLLQVRDLAQPLDLVDKQSGMDYYTAGTILAKDVDNGVSTVAPIPYFEDLFADAAGGGQSATQNIYDQQFSQLRGNETFALYDMDVYCSPGCGGQTGRYWDNQFLSLYAASSIGVSSYNAGQFTLRHPMKHGVQVDLSYTVSKSMDEGSDSEHNATLYGYGFLLEAFHPHKNYAVSDFDTRQLFTADWILHLPTGHEERFLAHTNAFANQLLSGWDLSGIARVASSLPFSLLESGYTTNGQNSSFMVQTSAIGTQTHLDKTNSGNPQAFSNAEDVPNHLRLPYPGEAGERNKFRGDGYFNLDAGLHKSFALQGRTSLQLAWEVFNATNSVRFDSHSIQNVVGAGSLGVYGSQLTQPRRMQLSARVQF